MTAFLFGYVAVEVIGTMQPASEVKRVTQREPNPMQNYIVPAFFFRHFLHKFFAVFHQHPFLQNCVTEIFTCCAGCNVHSAECLLSM